jgi:hypothetical protein
MKNADRVLRVQEPFTAEPAEGAENTRWLSGLCVLGGERLWAPCSIVYRIF